MKLAREIRAGLTGCLLCGRPVVRTLVMVPTTMGACTALLKIRETPIDDEITPTIGYGLCRVHARNTARSAARAQRKVLAAADAVVVQ